MRSPIATTTRAMVVSKALDLREAVARQAVQRGIMNVVSMRSKDQLADIMCKQADKGSFEAMRNAVLGMSMADVDESLRGGEASTAAAASKSQAPAKVKVRWSGGNYDKVGPT